MTTSTSEPPIERPVDLTDRATALAAGVAVEPVDALRLARLALANFRASTDYAEELMRAGDLWPESSAKIRRHQDGATGQARTAALVSIAESLATLAARPEPVYTEASTELVADDRLPSALVVVRPGDRLLLTFRYPTDPGQAAEVVDAVRRKYPDVEVLALAGVDVAVVPPLLDVLTEVGDDPEELGHG